jgi:hypothetical protein
MPGTSTNSIEELVRKLDVLVEHLKAVVERSNELSKLAIDPASATQAGLVEAGLGLATAAKELNEAAGGKHREIRALRDALNSLRLRRVPSPMLLGLVGLMIVAAAATMGYVLSNRNHAAPSVATSSPSTTVQPTGVSLPVRLTSADLRGAHFVNVDLSSVDLSSTCLMNARFEGVVLAGTKLVGADLRGAEFIGSDPGRAVGTFVIDGRTRFGLDKAPANAQQYDGKQSLPCDADRA